MKPVILNILRMSVYQIRFMNSIPDSAVCNEAVKLASKRGFYQLKGFVNGILRNIVRNKDNPDFPDASEDLVKHLSIVYSMPEWIVEQWIYQYGAESASRMIKSTLDNDNAISIRCNLSRTSVEECKKLLEEEGVTVKNNPYLEEALFISGMDYLGALKSFQDGLFMVQDPSSMLVAKIAAPQKNDYCIDVCAASGRKIPAYRRSALQHRNGGSKGCIGLQSISDSVQYCKKRFYEYPRCCKRRFSGRSGK